LVLVALARFFLYSYGAPRHLPSFPTRRSSDLELLAAPHRPLGQAVEPGLGDLLAAAEDLLLGVLGVGGEVPLVVKSPQQIFGRRSEEHTSELQSLTNLVCRLLLEKKKNANESY